MSLDPRINVDTTAQTDDIDFRVLVSAFRRHLWVLLGCLIVSVVGAFLYLKQAPKIYQASSILEVSELEPSVLGRGFQGVHQVSSGGYWGSQKFLQTQVQIASSRPVARRAAEMLGLASLGQEVAEELAKYDVGQYPASLEDLRPDLVEKLGLIGLLGVPVESIEGALKGIDLAGIVQGQIGVVELEDSNLLKVVAVSQTPRHAVTIANTVGEAFIAENLQGKIDTTESAVSWLDGQTQDLRIKLESNEQALQDFKEQNNLLSASIEERRSISTESLSTLNKNLTDVIATRLQLESKLAVLAADENSIEEIARHLAGDNVGVHKGNINDWLSEIDNLRKQEIELSARYTDAHPALKVMRSRIKGNTKKLFEETNKVLNAMKKRMRILQENERMLNSKVAALKAEVMKIGKKEMAYNRLDREAKENLQLYSLVIKRHKEAKLSQMLKVSNIRFHQHAVLPGGPIRPKPQLIMIFGALIGLFMGVVLSFALDFLDRTVKSQEQVERLLGVPFLGILPTIAAGKGGEALKAGYHERTIIDDPRSSLAECARAIRTSILFMGTQRRAQTIVVTSASPQEGKSTNASTLAITMAQSGAKTLVVDTDMRRPRIHKTFDLENEHGLTNVLLGDFELEQAITKTEIENLDILTCGIIPPNPAELLHTENFQKLVEELKSKYDRVIFDSPPISAVSDALVLGSQMDGTIFVMHAGHTVIPSAVRSVKRLREVGANILGGVLNDVDLDDKTGYYYHYTYYRSGYYIADSEQGQLSKG